MGRIKYLLSLSLSFAVFGVYAHEALGLRESIGRGIENNFSVRIAGNEEEMLANNATWGNAGFLPTVGASAGYSGTYNTQRQTAGDNTKTKNSDMTSDNYNVGLNVNWTIFDGLRSQTRYEKLQWLAQQGELNTLISIEDLVADIVSEYYNLIQQKIRLHNYQYAVELSEERLRIVRVRREQGSSSGFDIMQAQVDLNSDISALIRQRQAIVASSIALNRLLAGSYFEGAMEVADSLIDLRPMPVVEDILAMTMTDNTSLVLVRSNETIAGIDYKSTRSDYYPYLRFNGGYGYQYSKSDASTLKNQSTLGFNYGLTLGVNIFDGNKGRVRRNARLEMDNAALRRQNFELSLTTDLYNYWTNYRNNLELIRLEEESLEVAKENYRLAMERYYKLDNLSGLELREAQQSLLAAEDKLLVARYNTKIYEVVLMHISGRILEYAE